MLISNISKKKKSEIDVIDPVIIRKKQDFEKTS